MPAALVATKTLILPFGSSKSSLISSLINYGVLEWYIWTCLISSFKLSLNVVTNCPQALIELQNIINLGHNSFLSLSNLKLSTARK